jgi:reactive intermediate/imine deaminase
MKQVIHSNEAPQAVGTYSQAIKIGSFVFLSGQIPLDPQSMQMVSNDIRQQIHQVFKNLSAVAKTSGGSLDDVVKLTIYLTDLNHFPQVNEIMAEYFSEPYPARATVQVVALPKGAAVEMDAIMAFDI